MRPRVVDLFAGGGGFSEGFREAGFDVLLGLEADWSAARTFSSNFPNAVTLPRDVREISGRDVARYVGDVDVVIGGPPCEAFTTANPNRMREPLDRLYVDELGQLTLNFIRLVGELRPVVFVMENVAAIMEGGLESALRREFERIGYPVFFNVLHAEDFGTPSVRRRVFISNIRINPPRHGRMITVGEALEGLPPPDSGFPNHETVTVSSSKMRRIPGVPSGSSLYKFRGAKHLHSNFVRLSINKVAPTVMGSVRFIHPLEDRVLTVREQARLMGFPDSHVFHGSKDEQFNQVGEAVPVPLAKAIGTEVMKALMEEGARKP
ncbi:restriction endonuclease subunit M [Thermocladium modestius]|uniref:DNA (cytosine-5-)-methyltransferase n=1 Tax=Thermocladium modestius TaxID=62609 RepID=A0A830GU35_9CREN|nr:DNA cytosine methyltransferase [Thermocladium modestius]GGP19186.1 restriction endonuclease subunit M [Thermocladium modestius]